MNNNYYTDPKVTHPHVKIDVSIPKGWVSQSYTHDISPSFSHRGLQIFVTDEKNRAMESLRHKYAVHYLDTDEKGFDMLLSTNDWDEVLNFVNNHEEK